MPLSGGSSFCIDRYPAAQCRALCEAYGGAGGASGLGANGTGGSCAAYATSLEGGPRPRSHSGVA